MILIIYGIYGIYGGGRKEKGNESETTTGTWYLVPGPAIYWYLPLYHWWTSTSFLLFSSLSFPSLSFSSLLSRLSSRLFSLLSLYTLTSVSSCSKARVQTRFSCIVQRTLRHTDAVSVGISPTGTSVMIAITLESHDRLWPRRMKIEDQGTWSWLVVTIEYRVRLHQVPWEVKWWPRVGLFTLSRV